MVKNLTIWTDTEVDRANWRKDEAATIAKRARVRGGRRGSEPRIHRKRRIQLNDIAVLASRLFLTPALVTPSVPPVAFDRPARPIRKECWLEPVLPPPRKLNQPRCRGRYQHAGAPRHLLSPHG